MHLRSATLCCKCRQGLHPRSPVNVCCNSKWPSPRCKLPATLPSIFIARFIRFPSYTTQFSARESRNSSFVGWKDISRLIGSPMNARILAHRPRQRPDVSVLLIKSQVYSRWLSSEIVIYDASIEMRVPCTVICRIIVFAHLDSLGGAFSHWRRNWAMDRKIEDDADERETLIRF